MSGPLAVRHAVLAAHGFAAERRLAPAEGARLAIIVEELVTNLFDHGGLGDEDEISVTLSVETGSIHLVIEAAGSPFHPGAPRAGADVPERGGGAGLRLVQAWSIAIGHEHDGTRNRWTVILPGMTRE